MNRVAGVLALSLFASFLAVSPFGLAATPQQNKMKDCNAQADAKGLSGEGKGDERKAFVKECLSAKPATSASPQQEKMKTCNKEATGKNLKGDERKKFMSTCLSG